MKKGIHPAYKTIEVLMTEMNKSIQSSNAFIESLTTPEH